MEVDESVEYCRGRVSQCRVAVVVLVYIVLRCVPALYKLVKVLNLVLAQGGVALYRQPRQRCPSSVQFHAHAVRLLDVGGQCLAYVALLTSLHQLVVVVHVVEVCTHVPVAAHVLVASLYVYHLLVLRVGIVVVVGVVVTLWLAVCHGYRRISFVSAVGVAYASLRVEEVEVVVDVQLLVHVLAVLLYKAVVEAVGLVFYVAILQVGEHVPVVEEAVSGFQETAVVVLVGVRIVVFVLAVAKIFLLQRLAANVGDVAPVVAAELLQVHTADDIPVVVFEVHVVDHAVAVLCQTLLAYSVVF